jgi:Na+/H+-dicarboxylate symporter
MAWLQQSSISDAACDSIISGEKWPAGWPGIAIMTTENKDENNSLDFLGVFAALIVMKVIEALTTNRLLQAAGVVVLGIAAYFIPSKRRKQPALYAAALMLLTGWWIYGDKIWGSLVDSLKRL